MQKLINMQTTFIKDTSQGTTTWGMSEKSIQMNSQALTCLLGDSLASHFLFLVTEKDSPTQGERCFLKLQGFSKTRNPSIFSWKMLGVYYLTTKEKLTREYLRFLPRWGMMLNGTCLIAKTLELPTEESEYTLKDILEPNVEEKYYITPYLEERRTESRIKATYMKD